jgi:GNAT superfamily N-acetyltransferase
VVFDLDLTRNRPDAWCHRGVARVLLTEVSRLARQRGCLRLQLRCHRRRDDAHTFYRRLGFDETHLSFDREL